jgi:hypothetical protein
VKILPRFGLPGQRPQHAFGANCPLLARHRLTFGFESNVYGPLGHEADGDVGLPHPNIPDEMTRIIATAKALSLFMSLILSRNTISAASSSSFLAVRCASTGYHAS